MHKITIRICLILENNGHLENSSAEQASKSDMSNAELETPHLAQHPTTANRKTNDDVVLEMADISQNNESQHNGKQENAENIKSNARSLSGNSESSSSSSPVRGCLGKFSYNEPSVLSYS